MFVWTLAFSMLIGTLSPGVSHVAPTIVSLIPSLTEDLFAIGAGPQVVGVSQDTDYPRQAVHLPQVGGFSSVDAEQIVRLHPGLVVGIPAQASLVADVRRAGLHVELLPDASFDDLFATLARLGTLSGHAREAAALAARLRAKTAAIERSVPRGREPRTFVVLAAAPTIFTVGDGSYIARLLSLAGARNASGVREPYARYSAEAVVGSQPDAIVADKQSGLPGVLGQAPWNALHAVKTGCVFVLDDADILERPGPRYNEGLQWLARHLHPPAPAKAC